jgi:hypothetical protein
MALSTSLYPRKYTMISESKYTDLKENRSLADDNSALVKAKTN